jgi:hypothetical protein
MTFSRLRHDFYRAELFEVMVEGERLPDAEAFHDDFARAIREAPVLIIETLEDLPSQSNVIHREDVDFGQPRVEESLTEQERAVSFAAHTEQRQRLVNYVIRRQERLSVICEPQ